MDRGGVAYKVPRSLDELMRINSGIFYGYSQIGKFITVYPKDSDQFARLASDLDRATSSFSPPLVPFDEQFSDHSSVFYRYGAFRVKNPPWDVPQIPATYKNADSRSGSILTPLPDPMREAGRATESAEARPDKLNSAYRAFQAIVQRGKGGVYLAVDLLSRPCRIVVLKEGRRGGEIGWDGSDGADRVLNETQAIRELRNDGVNAPKIHDNFRVNGNCYLVLEKIAGTNFAAFLADRSRLTIDEVFFYGHQVASILASIHAAGRVWRDCKPSNLILTPEGLLRPIDFEGSCRATEPQQLPWGSEGFVPPEARAILATGTANLPEDLYALGVVLKILSAEKIDSSILRSLKVRRPVVPPFLEGIIDRLLDGDPQRRPQAAEVAALLA